LRDSTAWPLVGIEAFPCCEVEVDVAGWGMKDPVIVGMYPKFSDEIATNVQFAMKYGNALA
jgi:hypothetical protein